MMKKVLILGAGRGQIPIYEIAKKLGCETVFVTPKGNYPGLDKSKVRFADVHDSESVYEIAKEENVDAIITDQLDAGVFSCAYASSKLGLIGIEPGVAKIYTDKYEMRKAAEKADVAVPTYLAVKSFEEFNQIKDKLEYPLIMKPSDNASSRGIYLVDNEDELLAHFGETQGYSSQGIVLIERYIRGVEYVVETYVKDFCITPLIIGHRDYFDIPKKFIPKATVFRDASIANSHIEKKVLEANAKFIMNSRLSFGITHGEFIYSQEEDAVYLVEIAARGGGEFISAELIPLACGIRANELYVKHVLGIPYVIPKERACKASAYFSYLLPEGNILRISGLENASKVKNVHKLMFDNVEVGMAIPPIRDKASRKGPLLVKGDTKENCYSTIEEVKKKIAIDVKGKDGMIRGIIW